MKTTKSIIVVLFVLLTAQVASAYYCPSTGRWLSRDPIGEPGFQVVTRPENSASSKTARWVQRDYAFPKSEPNIYEFVGNNPVGKLDLLGLIGEGGVWPPPPNEINPPPSGSFKQCRIALQCDAVKRSGITLGTHCGLVIDTGDGVYDLNGSGGTENRRNLTPGSTSDATGAWTDNDPSVCDCLFSNIKLWNDRHVPRSNTCNNSNWNLKCMNNKCKVNIDWGSESKPIGYDCKECVRWSNPNSTTVIPGLSPAGPCCAEWKEKPCPDQ